MTFEDCCKECLKNGQLVKQFNRLTGHDIAIGRSPIQRLIDESTGYNPNNQETMNEFFDFVYNYVWLPTLNIKI